MGEVHVSVVRSHKSDLRTIHGTIPFILLNLSKHIKEDHISVHKKCPT